MLLKAAGTDASKQFDAFHNASILQTLATKFEIGQIGAAAAENEQEEITTTEELDEQEQPSSENNPLIMGETFGDMVPFGDPMWYQDWQSPYYNDSHRAVRKFVREFVDKEITPNCHEWDEAKKIPKEMFIKAAKAGILGAIISFGGEGKYLPYPLPADVPVKEWDAFHSLIVTDELSRCGSGGVSK